VLLFLNKLFQAFISMLFSPTRMLGRDWLTELVARTLKGVFDSAFYQNWLWIRQALANINLPNPYFRKTYFSDQMIAGVPCLFAVNKKGFDLDKTDLSKVDTVIVYLHGGGYVVGSPRTSHKELIAGLAVTNQALVIAPDYRLAPEYPLPIPQQDCINVVQACLHQYSNSKVVVAGDSAGGGLAVNCARQLADKGLGSINALVLLSPWVDPSAKGGSLIRNKDNDYLTEPFLNRSMDALLQGQDLMDERINFTKADLSMLPPTLVQAGTGEVFFDQIQEFCARLIQQNVDCTVQNYTAQFHVFQMFAPTLKPARKALDDIARFISAD